MRVRAQAQLQLSQMHCYTRPTQINNRCISGGLQRGVFRDFKLARVSVTLLLLAAFFFWLLAVLARATHHSAYPHHLHTHRLFGMLWPLWLTCWFIHLVSIPRTSITGRASGRAESKLVIRDIRVFPECRRERKRCWSLSFLSTVGRSLSILPAGVFGVNVQYM